MPTRPHSRGQSARRPGSSLRLDDITWTRIVEPRERYEVRYVDIDGNMSDRVIDLLKVGDLKGTRYLGVIHLGKFKTLRADRVVAVLAQLTEGHAASLHAQPTYATELPPFPVQNAVYKVGTIAAGNRTWTVDLNSYTCSCPEKRRRAEQGYAPGRLGFVCPHMARAILDHLPETAAGWTPELRRFLSDPRRVHIDNLH